jgi:hypothetical protein
MSDRILIERICELWFAFSGSAFELSIAYNGVFWRARCGDYVAQGDSSALAVEGLYKVLRVEVAGRAERAQKALLATQRDTK